MNIITSKSNNVIKNAKKLHQKKYRTDSYLIEGWHLFEEAVENHAKIRQVFVLEAYLDRVEDIQKVTIVTPEILSLLADSKTPQGIVAEILIEQPELPDQLQGRFLYLEDVQDPGNVGTMIRTADAAGFDGVMLSKASADLYSLKTLRSSRLSILSGNWMLSKASADLYSLKTLRSMQGSHFHIPIWKLDREELLERAAQSHLAVLATTLSEASIDYRQLPQTDQFILVMGNEGNGISQEMAAQADQLVHIPMPGRAESLNVAVAAGILMFSLRKF